MPAVVYDQACLAETMDVVDVITEADVCNQQDDEQDRHDAQNVEGTACTALSWLLVRFM